MEKQDFTPYQKFIIVVLALLQFTVVVDFMVLSPLGDILMKSLEISPTKFGWVVSAYAFSAGASGILAAGFADKFDRKKMLLFFYVGFVLGTLFCGMANDYLTLLIARIVTGIFGGVISSIGMAIITDLFTPAHRGKVLGIVQMSFAGSQVLGVPIGIYLANNWGWHSTFYMIVVLCIPLGLVVWKYMQPISAHIKLQTEKNAYKHLWSSLSNADYQKGFLSTAFLSIGGFMLMPFGSAFLVNNIHVKQEMLPLVFLATGISSMVVMPIIGILSDKFDRFSIFAFGSVWSAIMVVIYTQIPVLPFWMVVGLNMLMFMGIMSRIVPSTSLSSTLPSMKDRGAYMSINSSLQQIAGGLGSVVAGLIVFQKTKTSPIENYDILGIVCGCIILFCIFLTYRVSVLVKKNLANNINN